MSGLEGLFAIVIVALMPVALVFITRYYALREKELTARAELDSERLEALCGEKKRLELRVENLESIICAADFELDRRLLTLATPPASLLPSRPAARLLARGPRAARTRARRRSEPAIPRPATANKG